MLKIVGLFEVFRDGGEYHWILRDWDGEVLARNGGYITARVRCKTSNGCASRP